MLKSCIEKSGIPAECEWFESGEVFLRAFQTERHELVFMDIYMGGAKGVDVIAEIRKLDENMVVAFTTTSPDHALESYRLGALKYLEKPVSPERVKDTIALALMKRQALPKISLLIGGKQTELMLDNILYFEQRDHAILVHTLTGVLQTSQSVKMNSIEMELADEGFLRCHHSFIVNMRHVAKMDRDFVMKNGTKAHVRQADYKKMSDEYKRYLIGRTRGN